MQRQLDGRPDADRARSRAGFTARCIRRRNRPASACGRRCGRPVPGDCPVSVPCGMWTLLGTVQPEPTADRPAISHMVGVALGMLDSWHVDGRLRGELVGRRRSARRSRNARAEPVDLRSKEQPRPASVWRRVYITTISQVGAINLSRGSVAAWSDPSCTHPSTAWIELLAATQLVRTTSLTPVGKSVVLGMTAATSRDRSGPPS